jgi:hypothetical protein
MILLSIQADPDIEIEWRKVCPDAKFTYMVSNTGLIKQDEKLLISFSRLKKQLDFYHAVTIKYTDYNKQTPVHRLVAEAFVPNPGNKPYVNHKNGKKSDNLVSNLEWVTSAENSQHAAKLGLFGDRKGKNSACARLAEDQVLEIFHSGSTYPDIASKYGIKYNTVIGIKSGVSWGHLTGKIYAPKRRNTPNETILEIYRCQLPLSQIARKFKVGKTTVNYIKNGTYHSKVTRHGIS